MKFKFEFEFDFWAISRQLLVEKNKAKHEKGVEGR